MSFQAYLDNIQAKTGKSAADFKALATQKGLLKAGKLADGVTATIVVQWLKAEFALGHGHAMALFALFKGTKKKATPDPALRSGENTRANDKQGYLLFSCYKPYFYAKDNPHALVRPQRGRSR